jgi:hypothetical protein
MRIDARTTVASTRATGVTERRRHRRASARGAGHGHVPGVDQPPGESDGAAAHSGTTKARVSTMRSDYQAMPQQQHDRSAAERAAVGHWFQAQFSSCCRTLSHRCRALRLAVQRLSQLNRKSRRVTGAAKDSGPPVDRTEQFPTRKTNSQAKRMVAPCAGCESPSGMCAGAGLIGTPF